MKAKLFPILKIVVSASLLGLLFYLRRDSFPQTIEAIKGLEPAFFAASFIVFLSAVSILAVRLKVLLRSQGSLLKFKEAEYLTFIGYFFNNFLPTSIGGDVVKAYYASKMTEKENKIDSFICVFMDRFVGFLTLFILAGASLIFCYANIDDKSLVWFTLAVLFVLLFLFALFFNRNFAKIFSPLARLAGFLNIKEKAERVYNIINAFKDKKGLLSQAALLSFTSQITAFFAIYLLSKGMGAYIPIKMVLLFMPLVSIISMLPSINGLGIREGAIYFLFGPHIGYKNAFALSLLWLALLFSVGLIGGIVYLLKREAL